jgi:polysaccharide pyruvyl transferase WcaK-like protein
VNILILGDCYSPNLGDGVICESVRLLVRQTYPESEITIADLSGRNGFITEDLLVPSDSLASRARGLLFRVVRRSSFLKNALLNGGPRQLRYIKRTCSLPYDCAVFAGGQLFLDYFCIAIARYVARLSRNRVPVIFNACGSGEIGSRILLSALRRALADRTVASVTVRDNEEFVNGSLLRGTGKRADLSSDPALWSRELFGIERQAGEMVGLGIIAPYIGRDERPFETYAGIVGELNARGIGWELFCNGGHADYAYALEVAERLGYASRVAKRPQTPEELVRILSRYRSLISSRLHSLVIAVSLGVPCIALIWDTKVRSFLESIRCPDRCFDFAADPIAVVRKMLDAEKSGYDGSLISDLKQKGRDMLIGSIAGALGRNGA